MRRRKKITNNVDAAFSESLQRIGKKRGRKKKNVCLRIRFLGEKRAMELGLFTKKSITRLNYGEIASRKLTALRYSMDDFYFSFRAFHEMTMQQFKVKTPKDVAILLYQSPKHGRPLMVACVDGKAKVSRYVSDVLAILNMGDEQLN